MKILLLLSLCLTAGSAFAEEATAETPEPLYRNGGNFGPDSSDECPPHQPSATLKTITATPVSPAASPAPTETARTASR